MSEFEQPPIGKVLAQAAETVDGPKLRAVMMQIDPVIWIDCMSQMLAANREDLKQNKLLPQLTVTRTGGPWDRTTTINASVPLGSDEHKRSRVKLLSIGENDGHHDVTGGEQAPLRVEEVRTSAPTSFDEVKKLQTSGSSLSSSEWVLLKQSQNVDAMVEAVEVGDGGKAKVLLDRAISSPPAEFDQWMEDVVKAVSAKHGSAHLYVAETASLVANEPSPLWKTRRQHEIELVVIDASTGDRDTLADAKYVEPLVPKETPASKVSQEKSIPMVHSPADRFLHEPNTWPGNLL